MRWRDPHENGEEKEPGGKGPAEERERPEWRPEWRPERGKGTKVARRQWLTETLEQTLHQKRRRELKQGQRHGQDLCTDQADCKNSRSRGSLV